MKKSYKIAALVRHVITVNAYNGEDALEQSYMLPFKSWGDFKVLKYDIIDIDLFDDYEDASRDDLP